MIKVIKNFLAFCQPDNRKKFVKSLWFSLLHSVFEAMKIAAIYILIYSAIEKEVTVMTALECLVIMLISVIGLGFSKNHSSLLQTESGYKTCAKKRIDIAEYLRYVPMGYFNENTLGKVVSVTTNTMQQLEGLATRIIMSVSSAMLNTLVVTIVIFIFDFRIGFVVIAGLVLFALVNKMFIAKTDSLAPIKAKAEEELVSQVLEYIEGISEVKSYKLTGLKSKNLNDANDSNAAITFNMEKMFIPFIFLQTLIIKLIGVAMILASVLFYLNGTMSLVNCIIMIIASFIMYSALESTNSYSALLRTIDICINKTNKVFEAKQMKLDGEKESPKSFDIVAKNISFSYDEKKIIDNVSFEIKENTVTAIVGPSGSGKSTLTNLISRFWDVDEGEITLGGKNIKNYNYDTLMSNFSFVFQSVYLFKDTIANNIRFGSPEASMDKVVEAAKKARCHDFIMALPNAYDTIIGDEGVNLSGGERQRISIARAIMKDSPIIVLDEATANVDPENEAELMEAIDELTNNKTIIMIAHRLKTVENADQILVVENGHISQRGTHEELINEEGVYKRFIDARHKAVKWNIG
ncbi:MAG: ABC transporter ATP-binding protein/permease [Parasporobacterium sp.]|nr:ABC transporter ATP-binding protein/permease [Parasporobacterium sp.]